MVVKNDSKKIIHVLQHSYIMLTTNCTFSLHYCWCVLWLNCGRKYVGLWTNASNAQNPVQCIPITLIMHKHTHTTVRVNAAVKSKRWIIKRTIPTHKTRIVRSIPQPDRFVGTSVVRFIFWGRRYSTECICIIMIPTRSGCSRTWRLCHVRQLLGFMHIMCWHKLRVHNSGQTIALALCVYVWRSCSSSSSTHDLC